MLVLFRKIDIAHITATSLENPASPGIPMILALYRTEVKTAFYKTSHKKVLPEYREVPSGKRIPKGKWTGEMKIFAGEQLKQQPRQKTRFKITIAGWIFLLLCVATLGLIVFDRPAGNRQVVFNNLGEQVRSGDIYFGRFQQMTPGGLPVRDGYAWFKVTDVKADTVMIVLGKETTGDHNVPAEELSGTVFSDSIYKTTIREQKGYTIDFRTRNSEMMFVAGKKKTSSGK